MKNPRIDPNKKLLFTFQSAGLLLGVHPSLLKRAADRGQVRVIEIGRRKLIPKPEITRLSGGAIGEL
jgi:hypothetical protein